LAPAPLISQQVSNVPYGVNNQEEEEEEEKEEEDHQARLTSMSPNNPLNKPKM